MIVQEWINGGQEYLAALVPNEELQEGFFAHDGAHWYLELGVSSLEEEYITAWTYGLCGGEYPMHPEWVAMGKEDRSLLPLDLVNWLVENL
jgi:hypothetical protein